MRNKTCTLCPRNCHADRKGGHAGYCQVTGDGIRAARAALHFWEEPCISGRQGSGAVFFSGCSLRCVYCQNREIAQGGYGTEISKERLVEIFFELQGQGAANINLVTPSHYADQIAEAVADAKARGFSLPFVYNCGGYEKTDVLKKLQGLIDIYLTDFKYFSCESAARYSHAPDYPQTAKAAIEEMVKQQPEAVFSEDGMMQKGVIIRHLLLPGHRKEAEQIVAYLSEHYGNQVYLSLMSQYTPQEGLEKYPEINRRVTKREYDRLVDFALEKGVECAFIQEQESANQCYIPSFHGEGILKEYLPAEETGRQTADDRKMHR